MKNYFTEEDFEEGEDSKSAKKKPKPRQKAVKDEKLIERMLDYGLGG